MISSPAFTTCEGPRRATSHLGHVEQALDAAAQVDERADLAAERRARLSQRRRRSLPDLAACARCSSSRSARRETTRFLPPSLYSMIRKP